VEDYHEWKVGKDLERRGNGLLKALPQHLPEKERKTKKEERTRLVEKANKGKKENGKEK
jgi:hypothetical protein